MLVYCLTLTVKTEMKIAIKNISLLCFVKELFGTSMPAPSITILLSHTHTHT